MAKARQSGDALRPHTTLAHLRAARAPGAPLQGTTGGRQAGGTRLAHHSAEAIGGRHSGVSPGSAIARGASWHGRYLLLMEPWCGWRAGRHSPQRPMRSTFALALTQTGLRFLLLLLLLLPPLWPTGEPHPRPSALTPILHL